MRSLYAVGGLAKVSGVGGGGGRKVVVGNHLATCWLAGDLARVGGVSKG